MTGGMMDSTTENKTPQLGPWSTGNRSLEQRLAALAAFAPILAAPDFKAGAWNGPDPQGDVIFMGSFSLGSDAEKFIQAAYDYGWIMDFDWMTWNKSEEAQSLNDDSEALETATANQLAKLLTTRLRIDRFSEGSLAADFKRGLMTRIALRANELLSGMEASECLL
jgi:hypothetical protein